MQSEQIGELAKALANAQCEMEYASKDATNPFFKSKYADLASVIGAIKQPLSSYELSYVQYMEDDCLVTKLMHSSGQWQSGKIRLINAKGDMQGLGSAITYARRYGLSAMVGITQDDDDGEGSINRSQKEIKTSIKPKYSFEMGPAEIQKIKELSGMAKMTKDQLSQFITTHYKKPFMDLQEGEYHDLVKFLQDESQKETNEERSF